MSFIQLQKAATKGGEKVYVNLARSVRKGGKHPTQERTYLGVLEGEEVKLTKRVAGGTGCAVALSELRRRAGSGDELMTWLEERAGALREKEPSATVASVRLVEVAGPAHVLGHYARETGLVDCLAQGYGADGVLLLALAMHQAVTGQALYLAQSWLEEGRVEGWRKLSSPATSRLMARVGADDGGRERFFRAWIAACGRPRSLIFDTTSISTHSETLELAEWGYNRDGEDLPQVNLALVSARQGGAPLFYRTLPGSIPDVATLAGTGDLLAEYGLEEYTASLDRGFYSAANVAELLARKLGFILGVPFSNRQAQELLRRHRTALASTKRSLCFEGRAVQHARDTWVAELPKGGRAELAVHLYHDPVRHATQAASIERRVFALADRGNRLIGSGRLDSPRATAQWVRETAGLLASCLKVRRDGGKWRLVHQPRAVALAVARKGYSVVLASDPRAEPVEVLADYRSRDQV